MYRNRFNTLASLAVAAGALFGATAQAAATYPVPSGDIMDVPMDAPLQGAASTEGEQAPMNAATPMEQSFVFTPASTLGPLSRAEVREALSNARAAGTLVPNNEIGDTNESIAARDAYNELQAEVIVSRWNAESAVMTAAVEEERARGVSLMAQQEIDAVLAIGQRDAQGDPMAANVVDRREAMEAMEAMEEPIK